MHLAHDPGEGFHRVGVLILRRTNKLLRFAERGEGEHQPEGQDQGSHTHALFLYVEQGEFKAFDL